MRVPKKKKSNQKQTNIQAFHSPDSSPQFSSEQNHGVKSPSTSNDSKTNIQNQLQQVSGYSGFAQASISAPQQNQNQNFDRSSSTTEDQSLQKKSLADNQLSTGGATADNNNQSNPRHLQKKSLWRKNSDNNLQLKTNTFGQFNTSFTHIQRKKREDDPAHNNNSLKTLYQRVGTIQRANMIQRDIDKVEFTKKTGKPHY